MITITKAQGVALVLIVITLLFVAHAVGYAREEKTAVDVSVVQRSEDGAIIDVEVQRDGRPTEVDNVMLDFVDEDGNDAENVQQ